MPRNVGLQKDRRDMSRRFSNDLARAAAGAAFAIVLMSSAIAQADQPPRATGATAPLAKPESSADAAAANALKRGSVPPSLAGRSSDRGCREQAARMKLFGLGRHKFLQRCRRAARRKAAPR
jgi:hypothetical protein